MRKIEMIIIGALLLFASLTFAWATLSVSNVHFVSNDPKLNDDAWLLTVVEDGASEFAIGYLNPTDATKFTGDKKTKYPLKIEINNTKEKCVYGIWKQNEWIYHMQMEVRGFWEAPLGWEEECKAKEGFVYYKTPSGSTSHYCFWKTKTAHYGSISTPTLDFSSDIILTRTKDGVEETKKGTLTNFAAKSLDIYDDNNSVLMHADWTGSLTSGQQCPIASEQKRSAVFYNANWQIIDYNAYDTYKNYDEAGFVDCVATSDDEEGCVNTYNTLAYNALQPAEFNLYGPYGNKLRTATTSGTLDTGAVTMVLDRLIQYPVISMRIKASWLGVFLPVTEPKITSVSAERFKTGEIGYIVAKIENKGTVKGSVDIWADCSGYFQMYGTTITKPIYPNHEITVNIPIQYIGPMTTGTVCGTCRVYAVDTENTEKQDSTEVSVLAEAIITCTPDEKRCNGNILEQCNKAGNGWFVLETCPWGCGYKDGQAMCNPKPGTCGNGVCQPDLGETPENCPQDCLGKCKGCISLFKSWLGLGKCEPEKGQEIFCGFWFGLIIMVVFFSNKILRVIRFIVPKKKKKY